MFQFSGIDISVYVPILFGALILYFGILIGGTKVESYDKLGYYIEGLFFVIIYIFFPSIFAYFVKNLFGSPPFWIFLLTHTLILGALLWNFLANELLKRYEIRDDYKKRTVEKINKIKDRHPFLKKYELSFIKTSGLSYADFNLWIWDTIPIRVLGNKTVLFMLSFLAILPNFYLLESELPLNFVISLLFTFFILTMCATAYGFSDAYYPPAKIYMDDGKVLEGKILKFGDIIYLINGNKKFFINKDKINYVEENLFKKQSEDYITQESTIEKKENL